MKVIVCGGRDYDDRLHLEETLDLFHERFPIAELIHGAARGADTMAGNWAKSRNIPKITGVPANWDVDGKSAGYLRNVRMAEMGPDLVIAFSGGRGTMMMIGIALKMGIDVLRDYEIL